MNPEIQLDPHEARLFGVLVEKAMTTPDQYPLSINAATNGSNQKSNRDPVLTLEEHEVAGALARLEKKYLARKVFPGNSRVEKYVHNAKDALNLSGPALAVVAELLLRGPQTVGELRTHAGRMVALESLEVVLTALSDLIDRGYAQRLEPSPGSRAERYVQLLSPDLHPVDSAAPAPVPVSSELTSRVARLEAAVAELQEQVRALTATAGNAGGRGGES
jgi:uncharacterized protein YceH (UPF0502 family)